MLKDKDPREIIRNILKTNLIGPANELFDTLPEAEIITGKPLNKYYSAILFPRLDGKTQEKSISTDDDIEAEGAYSDTSVDENICEVDVVLDKEDVKDDDIGNMELYPSSMGLTFCLKPEAETFNCITKFGTYDAISPKEKSYALYSVKMPLAEFQKIQAMSSNTGEYDIKLTDLFRYDATTSTVLLKRPLQGSMVGIRTGDFKALDSLWQSLVERSKKTTAKSEINYNEEIAIFSKLMAMSRSGWKRTEHIYNNTIDISNLLSCGNIRLWLVGGRDKTEKNTLSASLDISVVKQQPEYILVRVVLVNSSSVNMSNYIPNNEILNSLSMFQSSIEITNKYIIPLPAISARAIQTREDSILDCQYRERLTYGQAHNCSFEKLIVNNYTTLRSTYLPTVRPDVIANNTENIDVNKVLSVHRNSSFSSCDNDTIIAGLRTVCKAYHNWITGQENIKKDIQPIFSDIAAEIVDGQRAALARMIRGVDLLQNNEEILECYKLANASMLINMLIATESYELRQDISHYYSSEFENHRYHIFQLAFLLLNIEGIVDPGSSDRKELVDILWFPTGGGKTEAYLLLVAFTLLWRRKKYKEAGHGTAIIMRYTLRLLTSQQFERASKIILAMNFVCREIAHDFISDEPFSIGLWIGRQSSPNKLSGEASAEECISNIIDQKNLEYSKSNNKIPIDTCPWCGESLIKKNEEGQTITGYRVYRNRFHISCLNPHCKFHNLMPIDCIDESLYANPPSLLFATIDKFAQLAWKSETNAFFGSSANCHPPELIIQDELHLIAGPLGTISGLFENVIELMCSRKEFIPKIIASTATINNATAQVEKLYGNRKAFSFPPPGLNFSDNFFAVKTKSEPNREYIGVYPTGKTFITTQIRLLPLLLYSRWNLLDSGLKDIDNYWSIVSYHNSLRELGRIVNKTGDEITQSYKMLIRRNYPEKLWRCRINYPKELTSRISGYAIKRVLASVTQQNIIFKDLDSSIAHSIDLIFATNMISVGLDIDRFNLMLVNGQPRSISEYVQVTSRIARKYPGLVVSVFNPLRIRDKSHFEAFEMFHNSYYRFIEPVSITPFTKAAIDRMSATILAAYLRTKMGIEYVKDINNEVMEGLYEFFYNRIKEPEMSEYLVDKIKCHLEFAKEKLDEEPMSKIGNDLLIRPSDVNGDNFIEGIWIAMDSMRDIGSNAVLKVHIPKRKR